jgi:hypothetical protein
VLPQAGHREAVEVLLQREADPAAANCKGQRAADLCDEPELKQLLVEARARSTVCSLPSSAGCGLPVAETRLAVASHWERQLLRRDAVALFCTDLVCLLSCEH